MKILKKPEWLKKKLDLKAHSKMSEILKGLNLNTICKEASCPNISECFSCGRATFLIMGVNCTRGCRFCNVAKDTPEMLDDNEAMAIAEAVNRLQLQHVVITSPTRDDLEDGGANHFARTINEIKKTNPTTIIEVLVPDFQGNTKDIKTVLNASPDIFGHNLETVKELYSIRQGANYHLSLAFLKNAGEFAPNIKTKSGIMLGFGETETQVISLMDDLIEADVKYLSIGQYLSPSKVHEPVVEYVSPDQFDRYKKIALEKGFEHIESAPYVRSSYMAEKYYKDN